MHPIIRKARETLARLEGCEERFARDDAIRARTEEAIRRRNKRAPKLIYKKFWNPTRRWIWIKMGEDNMNRQEREELCRAAAVLNEETDATIARARQWRELVRRNADDLVYKVRENSAVTEPQSAPPQTNYNAAPAPQQQTMDDASSAAWNRWLGDGVCANTSKHFPM